MDKIIINARRSGYSTKQCGHTLTVGELKELLENYDEETPIFLSHDNGYTYGSIREDDIDIQEDDEE